MLHDYLHISYLPTKKKYTVIRFLHTSVEDFCKKNEHTFFRAF